MRMRDVFVVAMLFMVPIEVRDSREPLRVRRVFFVDGDSDTLAMGTKTPYLGLHSKYLQEKVEIVDSLRLNLKQASFCINCLPPYAIDGAIVFATGLIQLDATPVARRKLCLAQIAQQAWPTAKARGDNHTIANS